MRRFRIKGASSSLRGRLGRVRSRLQARRRARKAAAPSGAEPVAARAGEAASRRRSPSPQARRRLALALAALAALVLLAVLAVPALPCSWPDGDACVPEDDAAALVPGTSIAYLHANLDPESDQYVQAAELAERVPQLSRQIIVRLGAQLPGRGGVPADFDSDVRPWSGGEVAVALVPRRRGAEQVQLIEAADSEAALDYAGSVLAGGPRSQPYRDVDVRSDRHGLTTALVDGFLVLGARTGVRSVIDVARGADGASSLADQDTAAEVRDALPQERLADAYVSGQGVRDLLAGERGPLVQFEPLVDAAASRGAALALVAGEEGFEAVVHSRLDPELARADPGFFAAFGRFEPQIPAELAADTLAYAGIGNPPAAVEQLQRQAARGAPELARGFRDVVARLQRLGKVDLERDLLPALGEEAALALTPGRGAAGGGQGGGGAQPPPEQLPGAGLETVTGEIPSLLLVATGVDEAAARDALARLQGPLTDALGTASASSAVFERRRIAGVDAQSARLSPAVELTYAVFDSMLAVATQPQGIAALADRSAPLADDQEFETATDGFPAPLSMLAYLDLTGLVQVAEQQGGLGEDPSYATFAPEVHRLRSLGLAVDAGTDALDTEVRLVIAAEAPGASTGEAAPSGGE